MRFVRRCIPFIRVGIRLVIAIPLTLMMLKSLERKKIEELWEWAMTPLDRGDIDRGKFTQLHLSD
jgi:hypothetical protein